MAGTAVIVDEEWDVCSVILLPTGSKEKEVLGAGSIHVAILLSCHHMNWLPHSH